MSEKLKCFLYMLMRDELPCGKVAQIMQEIAKLPEITNYSNEGLAEYADEVMRELTKKKKK